MSARCSCGNKIDVRAQFGMCRPCRKAATHALSRRNSPITLADQIVAWSRWREGDCIFDIANRLRRLPSEARLIAFGPSGRAA